jgi:hypothetical protein
VVVRDGAGRGKGAGSEREPDGDRSRQPGTEAERRRCEREQCRGQGNRQRSEARVADQVLQLAGCEEERRVALSVGGGEAGQGNPGRESDQAERDQRVRDSVRPTARREETEGDEGERQDVEEVALLNPVGAVRRVQARLEEDRGREQEGQAAEGKLVPRAGPRDCERDADHSTRREDPTARVENEHRIGGGPFPDRENVQVQVENAVVVAQESVRSCDRERHERQREEPERKALVSERPADAAFPQADEQRGGEEADRQDDELDTRQGRETGEDYEFKLSAARGAAERADSGRERGKREWIREWVSEDP